MSQGGFFSHMMAEATNYYCAKCYQDSFGTKCSACNNFVEGEVVTALGNTYHQQCFRCSRCKYDLCCCCCCYLLSHIVFVTASQPFPTGEKVTWTGKECICQKCVNIPIVSAQPVADGTLSSRHNKCLPVTSIAHFHFIFILSFGIQHATPATIRSLMDRR